MREVLGALRVEMGGVDHLGGRVTFFFKNEMVFGEFGENRAEMIPELFEVGEGRLVQTRFGNRAAHEVHGDPFFLSESEDSL